MKALGGTYRLTFFSDSRLESLSTKLRNNKVNDLVRRISTILKNRVRSPDTESVMSSPPDSGYVDNASAARHIAGKFCCQFNAQFSLFQRITSEFILSFHIWIARPSRQRYPLQIYPPSSPKNLLSQHSITWFLH